MTGPVRVGIIGAGFGQQVHVPAFRADTRCEVVAICAKTLEHAARAAERLGIPQAYGDARQMLADGRVDGISIAVPPVAQPDLVIAAAEAGKHVFCEKPLATDEAAATRALAAVKDAGVVHAIDFIFPEIESWQRARKVLQEGTLGRLRHAALSWRVETYAFATGRESWKARNSDGGGTLSNFVSHSLYYLEWLLGPVARIAARLTPRGAPGDARVDVWLEMVSTCPVTVSVAADAFLGSGHRLEIYGEQGTLLLENRTTDYANGFTFSVGTRANAALSVEPPDRFSHPDGRIGATSAIARRFIGAILSGAAVKPDLVDGARVQHLITAVREADRTGGWQYA